MSDKILVNKYIPGEVLSDLPWYERDVLLTYINKLKCEPFISNLDKYLEKVKVVNFEIIHAECCGSSRNYSDKYYQTV